MPHSKQNLEREFLCPKCRNRGGVVQEVQLGRSVARMLPLAATPYWAVSCALCGYTELYSVSILERSGDEASQTNPKLAQKPE